MTTGSIRLAAVGDIMLGDSAICVGFGFATRYDDAGLERVLSQVRAYLADADIGFGNLEAVLSDRGLGSESLSSRQMRGRSSYARVLRHAGFNVLNVANNHAVQHGVSAFDDTVAALRSEGIEVCGLRGVDGWCSQPVTIQARGVSVGILGYCLRPRQYGSATPPFAEGSIDEMREDVRRLRQAADHVVVSLHWGEEFVGEPSEGEVQIGEALVDAGASVIIGHHPHVTRPTHRHSTAVIAYSLGNFVSDMIWMRGLRLGAILRCDLSRHDIRSAEYVSVQIDRRFAPIAISPPQPVDGQLGAPGLPQATYEAKVRQALTRQRIAAYAYALRNAWRYPRNILRQMIATTAKNKLAALLPGK